MPFSVKDWKDYPDTSTPITQAALEDMETRLSTFTAQRTSVSVSEFGAVGNGTTDDRAAIQSALDAVDSAGGGAVFLPAGNYYVNTNLTTILKVGSNTVLYGEGPASRIFNDLATAAQLVTNKSQGSFGANVNITIRDLCLDRRGSGTNLSPYDNCVHMRAVDGVTIQNVWARGAMKAIHIEGCSHAKVLDNLCDSFRDNGIGCNSAEGYGATAVVDPQVLVQGNTIRQTSATIDTYGSSLIISGLANTQIIGNSLTATSALIGYGVEIAGGSSTTGGDMLVEGNTLSGCGVLVGGGPRHTVRGNTIIDGSVAGSARIVVATTAAASVRAIIEDNYLRMTSGGGHDTLAYAAILISTGATYARVIGNYVTGGGRINVGNDDATVAGNTVEGSTQDGYYISSCSRSVIRDNIARDCGSGGSSTTAVGFTFDTLTNPNIERNIAVDNTSVMAYGFYINAGTAIKWSDNVARGYATAISTSTNTPTYHSVAVPTVTFTAGTVNLGDVPGSVVAMTSSGAVTTTNITATGLDGRVITFVCKNASVTLTDSTTSGGNNLYLNGNFSSATDATLTLACDGSKWYEISRSTNYTA